MSRPFRDPHSSRWDWLAAPICILIAFAAVAGFFSWITT